jgi:hypothetical protein
MFRRIQDDERFLDSVIFSEESTSHVSGKVSTHNCRIWGSENPRVFLEHVPDSSKVNVFCALSKERVSGLFFFMKMTITSIVYLDMLQQLLIPQLDPFTSSTYLGEVREYLNTGFPGRGIGRAAPIAWPPRSPDLTLMDFYLMEIR